MATMCLIAHWIACIWHFLYAQAMHLPWLFSDYERTVPGETVPSQFLVAFYSSFVLMVRLFRLPRDSKHVHIA